MFRTSALHIAWIRTTRDIKWIPILEGKETDLSEDNCPLCVATNINCSLCPVGQCKRVERFAAASCGDIVVYRRWTKHQSHKHGTEVYAQVHCPYCKKLVKDILKEIETILRWSLIRRDFGLDN